MKGGPSNARGVNVSQKGVGNTGDLPTSRKNQNRVLAALAAGHRDLRGMNPQVRKFYQRYPHLLPKRPGQQSLASLVAGDTLLRDRAHFCAMMSI